MSTAVVRFPPRLGEWVATQLALGESAAALEQAMQEQRIAEPAARAIVAAFVRASRDGTPPPTDVVALSDTPDQAPSLAYRADAVRMPSGARIETFDRVVRVAARTERPTLAVLHDVMSAAERAELIELARGRLQPSTIVEPTSGRDIVAPTRGSHGMFFRPAENALVARLDRRFAELMGMPVEHGEGLQVLHYPCGAGSAPHFDFLVPSSVANRASIERSGQRIGTLVAYLNDVSDGGETVFPAVGWSVSPAPGHAVAFEYGNAAGDVDSDSLHASAPVRAGEKWVATKWLRARPFISA